MMWNAIVNANWIRDRKSASNSISAAPPPPRFSGQSLGGSGGGVTIPIATPRSRRRADLRGDAEPAQGLELDDVVRAEDRQRRSRIAVGLAKPRLVREVQPMIDGHHELVAARR